MKEFTETERHFIGLLHDTINRMANNSANCKNWFMAVVAAIIAYVANNPESADVLWVLLFIDLLFYGLDSYYLQLEKNFRDIECNFVQAVKDDSTEDGTMVDTLLYNFNYNNIVKNGGTKKEKNICKALKSPSTWLFYSSFFILIIIVYCCIVDFNIINWIASLNDCRPCCNCCK